MDMKKMIDDTDFDNFNELTKKWKKDPNNTSKNQSEFDGSSSRARSDVSHEDKSVKQKENVHQQISVQSNTKETAPDFKKKREVMPQVIDEDTQHFRNRLEHLLNGFKTDAVSEFMSMKKAMLDYQKETIKGDTQKYLTMYQEKHQQLLQAKDKLITLTSDVQKKSMQIQLMSTHIAKLNQRLKTNRYLSRPFALLYENKVEQKTMKIKTKQACKHNVRRLELKAFNGWRNMYREVKKEKEQEINNQKVEIEVKDIVAKFQKQIQSLKQKLYEANQKIEDHQNSKHMIQENLKKAFFRGISSMNMEAMGIFGGTSELNQFKSDNFEKNISEPMNSVDHSMMGSSKNGAQLTLSPKQNSSVIMNKSKLESKDHKWKEAPIVGYAEKDEAQEPRTQLVKPTSEAKVIRVIDGKSSVDSTQKDNKFKKSTVSDFGNRTQVGKKKP